MLVLKNTVAIYLGQVVHTLLALVLVPVYIACVAIEGDVVIGFLAALIALLQVFADRELVQSWRSQNVLRVRTCVLTASSRVQGACTIGLPMLAFSLRDKRSVC